MRRLLLALCLLPACGEPCPTPLAQHCDGPTRVMTCSTPPSTLHETQNCDAILPRSARWTCCRPVDRPDAPLACRREAECDPSYARRSR